MEGALLPFCQLFRCLHQNVSCCCNFVLLLAYCCRSLECRHTGCSSASELDTSDLKQLTNSLNSLSIASVLTSASNSLPQSDHTCDDSGYCVPSSHFAVDNTNSLSSSSAAMRETVLNRSNAFRVMAPPPPTNGLVSNQPDVKYRSTASCQLCRNLREKCTVRLLPTVAEQTVWMPNSADSSGRVSDHSPLTADHIIDVSTQLSNLAVDGISRTSSLSDQSSSSSSEL